MPSTGKVNILICDDEPANLLVLETILEGLGENLVRANSGEEALKRLLREDFAVVILDIQMPGIDGFETARLMRSRRRTEHTPIIFLTAAYQSDEYMFRGYSLGAVDYLNKPVRAEVLKAKVSAFVDLFKKTAEVQRQAEQLREMERREYERSLAEARQQWEAERIQDQLNVAAAVQRKLFPTVPPECQGFDIHGASFPAETTGGDYFDFIEAEDGNLGVVVGDVSGHGFGPSLLMASTRAYLRALLLAHQDVGQVLTLANRALAADVEAGRFVTLLLGRLDLQLGILEYSSAGHLPAFVLDGKGDVKAKLESTSLPLGIAETGVFPVGPTVRLEPGDMVLLYTDGLVEVTAADGQLLGIEAVLNIVRQYQHESSSEIVARLYRAVGDFASDRRHDDDVTVVVIKFEGKRTA